MSGYAKDRSQAPCYYARHMRKKSICFFSVLFFSLTLAELVGAQGSQPGEAKASLSKGTHVVLLGTGNPSPDPDRAGPATAIVVNGSAYLVDMGAGVVRRARERERSGRRQRSADGPGELARRDDGRAPSSVRPYRA